MLIRSLALATLFTAVVGAALAADSDDPLAQDRGQSRPLIIIASSSVDPTVVSWKKALDEPANRAAFNERHMVLYTVINLMGQRDGKSMDAQTTMALIRELKIGAGGEARVILVGKDGEKKIEHSGPIDPKEIFAAIDQMPMREKEASAPATSVTTPTPAPDAAAQTSTKTSKSTKTGKAPPAPPKSLDD
ncbi:MULTISPECIES: DUF4174 domain-containing protein [unclassified Pseudomonas]|uniref:DUF4174 domain-containing protein n=1 Tax=unclassified Pseudomonas TaxID=196821 RepID=UPI002AC9782E|nr:MULTISPECIES: DUF4174 domain-containing protein [unclassified Pseudomonas]MEB0039990.1 DUF4174 domain-containing protein [Pseudomonas sp. MH10]MEB0076387.1 DUF4174 domain-containing protein [Pseudomonas sp. MH10out]MEB0092720.1 DUF4174 domain-containing protein [Pseudomonas sp. CCI4.2]MEB0100782.1 DUF4174 domain-containing protein [Pseudomonas sp. CCI3.2]MEB0119514.1 DUF4174 domain-containing protein [Pseudomonas sp. CCI1.2]